MATSPAEAAAAIEAYFVALNADRQQFRDWLGGTATGGPNGDGRYPLTDFTGTTYLVACPAKLEEIAGEGALNLANLPTADETDAVAGQPIVPAISAKDSQPKKFTVNLFASRRTQDLAEVSAARVDQLMQLYDPVTGLSHKASLGAIAAIANNLTINLASPPYNVKPDFQEVRDGITTDGSNLLDSNTANFKPEDVGKMILVSNAMPDPVIALASTIVEYISPTRVRMAHAAGRTFGSNRVGWGTDNTEAVRQACLDSEALGQYSFGATVIVPQGGILTRPFRPRARTTWMGYGPRQSYFVKAPALPGGTVLDGLNQPFIRNAVFFNGQQDVWTGKTYEFADDFLNLLFMGVHGAVFWQPGGDSTQSAIQFRSVLGGQTLAQVDPFWRLAFVDVWDASGNGIHILGRSSMNAGFVNIINAWNNGWVDEGFDNNVNTLITTGCGQCGIQLGPNGGSNGNYTTIKSSYNGNRGFSKITRSNMALLGNGFVITGTRLQESTAENLIIGGHRNEVTGGSIEDTGCMRPRHSQGPSPAQEIRPAITLDNSLASGNPLICYGNKVKNVMIGPQVHVDVNAQYASHAIYLRGHTTLGSPQYNDIDVTTAKPFGSINLADGSVTPWSWQDYGSGAGLYGKDGNSNFAANTIRIDGALATD